MQRMLLAVFFIGYLLLQLRGVRSAWRAYQKRFPSAKFSYTILEFYALIIALTPTYACIALMYRIDQRWLWSVPIVAFCQIAGALQSKLWQGTPPGIPRGRGTRPLPVEVAIGALKGFLLVIPLFILTLFENSKFLLALIACLAPFLPLLAAISAVSDRRRTNAKPADE